VTVRDSPLDDRDCGLTALSDGRLLAHLGTTFWTANAYHGLPYQAYRADVLARWIAHVETPAYRAAKADKGGWCLESADGGRTWSAAAPGPDSVHGGVELLDGSALVVSYRDAPPGRINVWEGRGRPVAWKRVCTYEPPRIPNLGFGEPHVAQLRSGRLIMMMRGCLSPYDDADGRNGMWVTYSDDAGRTWAEAKEIPVWGFPPHLLLLSDGRLLCSYGHRRRPFGQRACVSVDGLTWRPEDEVILRSDANLGDLGYPASAELSPGKILTVYYQPEAENPPAFMKPPDPERCKPAIWATTWDLRD
jgi:sialidase-1